MAERKGYRGYIGTRPLNGSRTPQSVQNLVVRDYAQRNKLQYLLSSVEYAMPNCYLMLNEILAELPRLEGLICYSLFMLPSAAARRQAVYRRVLESGGVLHAALEAQALRKEEDAQRWEEIWLVQQALASSPTVV
jgi:sporadic carbohydrate cluster protein (TIGR04323 family)